MSKREDLIREILGNLTRNDALHIREVATKQLQRLSEPNLKILKKIKTFPLTKSQLISLKEIPTSIITVLKKGCMNKVDAEENLCAMEGDNCSEVSLWNDY